MSSTKTYGPKCDDCGEIAVHSTENRYEPLGHGTRFGCNGCGLSAECSEGYFRCLEHTNDWCAACFEQLAQEEREQEAYGEEEASQHDASEPNASEPDASEPDASEPNASEPDASEQDETPVAKDPVCPECPEPFVYSVEERYRKSHNSGLYGCDDCGSSFACAKGYYRCKTHYHDLCEDCFILRGGVKKELTKPEGPPKCEDCQEVMVFSTEERYLASHRTSRYGCDNCKKNKECSQGFYRCLEHFHDLCADCFVKAGGTAAVVPKCGDCKLPLVFSTDERYRASHGTGEYACDDCRETKECRTGYYRCMNHYHDFCEACFVKQGGEPKKKIQPKCDDCHKALVYSTEARYLKDYNSPAFGCNRCHLNKICTQGYFRCMEHANDYCEECYVLLGGEPPMVVKPPCPTCDKPLKFDVFERYKESHNTTRYNCDDCRKNLECKDGFYRCSEDSNDLCESCYVKKGGRLDAPIYCDECPVILVYSTEPRYFKSHGSKDYGCGRCRNDFQCKDGYWRCMEHYTDYCVQCYRDMKKEKAPRSKEEREMVAFPLTATCNECNKEAVYSTENRYEARGFGTKYGCNECGRSKECKDGFWRCEDHDNDWCKECYETIKETLTRLQQIQIKCPECQNVVVFSIEERYKAISGGSRYGCGGCSRTFECKSGYYRCMKDQEDWCKDCYREMQMEEAERQEYSEAESEESDTPDGLYEELAQKTKVKCNSCSKHMIFSREERYLESHGSGGYSCETCQRDFNCKRGYFRCSDHYTDYCKDCFLEKQAEVENETSQSMMRSSMSKALQEETFTIACRVEKCGKPLEYSEKDRYLDSDNKTTFDCQGCAKAVECSTGYYRCEEDPIEFCEDCYNAKVEEAKQLEEIKKLITTESGIKKNLLGNFQMTGRTKDTSKNFGDVVKTATKTVTTNDTQPQVTEAAAAAPVKTNTVVKCRGKTCGALLSYTTVKRYPRADIYACNMCLKPFEQSKGFFRCPGSCKFDICVACQESVLNMQPLLDDLFEGASSSKPAIEKSVVNDKAIDYRELVKQYKQKTTRQRVKLVKSKFIEWFGNPLADFQNKPEELSTFFTVEEAELPPTLKYFDLAATSEQDSIREDVESMLKGEDFSNTQEMSDAEFQKKLSKINTLFDNKESFNDFLDPQRRKLVFKGFLTSFSKEQNRQLLTSIFQRFRKNQNKEIELEEGDGDEQDRRFNGDLFKKVGQKLEPTQNRARSMGTKGASNLKYKILTKWTGLNQKFEKLATLIFPVECTLLKSLTSESLFYVKEKQLVIINMKDLTTRLVKVPEFSPVNLTLLYNKYLIGELTNKADKLKIVIFDINAGKPIVIVHKKVGREKLYVIPNEKLEPHNFEESSKMKVEDLDLTFMFEGYRPSILYVLTYQDLQDNNEKNLRDFAIMKQPLAKIKQSLDQVNFTRGGKSVLFSIKKDLYHIEISKAIELAEKNYAEYLIADEEQKVKEAEREAREAKRLADKKEEETKEPKEGEQKETDGEKAKEVFVTPEEKIPSVELVYNEATKISNIALSKNMFSRLQNFVMEINTLDNKIIARQFTSFFKTEATGEKITPLMQTGFCLDENRCPDIVIEEHDDGAKKVMIIGLDKFKKKLKVLTQEVFYEKELDDVITPQSQFFFIDPLNIQCFYPIIAQNMSDCIYFQNLTAPDLHFSFQLKDQQFVQFCDFKSMDEICFLDKRTNLFNQIPFEQTDCRVVFLTKAKGMCRPDCIMGDMLINVMEIDAFSSPMKFTIHTSPYEACMGGGVRNDLIVRSFVINAISDRGYDIVLACQYNDCVIFDCVTSTLQEPIKVPQFKSDSSDFVDLEVSKSGTMVKVPMIMGDSGALYWLHWLKDKEVGVLRHNPKLQMGNSQFIKTVANMRAEHIYFFLYNDGEFYIMDQTHRIKVFKWNDDLEELEWTRTLKYLNSNSALIEKSIFDDFMISKKVLHCKDYMFYMFDNRANAGETFFQSRIVEDNESYLFGPKKIHGSNMVMSASSEEVFLHPLGDMSYIDFLPNRAETTGSNFTSFIGDNHIICAYGGKILIFDKNGILKDAIKLTSAFKPDHTSFLLEDYKTLFVEKLSDNFMLNRFDLTLSDKNVLEYKQVGTVSNRQLKTKLDKNKVLAYQQGIYENRDRTEIETKKRRFQPCYLLADDGTISTFVWKLIAGGIAVSETVSFKAFDESGAKQDKPEEERSEILFKFEEQSVIAQQLSTQVVFDVKAKAEMTIMKDLVSKFNKSGQDTLLDMFDNNRVKFLATGSYYVLKVFNTMFYKKNRDLPDLQKIELNFDSRSVHILNIHKTATQTKPEYAEFVQIEICDFDQRLYYVVTWNLTRNKQHNLYQGVFQEGKLPTNYLIRSQQKGSFNCIFDQGAIIDLRTNVPIHFLDAYTQKSLIPESINLAYDKSCRISSDLQLFLGTNQPGRQHSFISLSELLYWERFRSLKTKHELYQGHVIYASPLLRAPNGVSIFSQYLSNPKVIRTLCDVLKNTQEKNLTCYFHKLLPLSILYSNPAFTPKTALQLSLEKNLLNSFNNMLRLLVDRTDVAISRFFVDSMKLVIDSNSPVVNDFLNSSFVITQQFDEPIDLNIPESQEEAFKSCDTTFLSNTKLQKIVYESKELKQAPIAGNNNDDDFIKPIGDVVDQNVEALLEDAIVRRQMESKVLDFDWISEIDPETEEPRVRQFIKILAQTPNDSVFATAHIRVLIEFMWARYFVKIRNQLFYPFVGFFLCFHLLATWLSDPDVYTGGNLQYVRYAALTGVICFGLYYATMEAAEYVYNKAGWREFFDFWNCIDMMTLGVTLTYVVWSNFEFSQELNVLAAFGMLLMWAKMFYWMRLFRPFAAFIRMISDIITQSSVFLFMLVLMWSAFANILVILQLNRVPQLNNGEPVEDLFDSHFGVAIFDSLLNAYLLGLGEFGMDNFDNSNKYIVWICFIGATFLIQLVFMNLLIAIMSDAYANISAISEQSVLKELVSLLDNYLFLIPSEQLFEQGNKYIVWVSPDTEDINLTEIDKSFIKLRDALQVKTAETEANLMAKLEANDEQTQFLRSELARVVDMAEKNS